MSLRGVDRLDKQSRPTYIAKSYPTSLHLYVPDADAVYRRAMTVGAASLNEPSDQEYGDREAGITDPSGNQWYIATHKLNPGGYRPEGLHAVTLYLHPIGATDLIRFMQEAFDAEQVSSHVKADGTIAHAEVKIGDAMIEMSEAHGQWQPMPASSPVRSRRRCAVCACARGRGNLDLTVTDQPYGERSGGVKDPWENRWWITTYMGKVTDGH